MVERSPSPFARIIALRTYCRPKPDGSFETWQDLVDRVIDHQKWLWERYGEVDEAELYKLRALMLKRKVLPGGRVLWLGGTDLAKRKAVSNFNCTFVKLRTVHDLVDIFWCLLNGAGVGIEIVPGTLSGFPKPVKDIEIVRSKRTDKGGIEVNQEFYDPDKGEWRLVVGDSGEAWAKAVGKLLSLSRPVRRIVLDFGQIRPAGMRLSGYGYISSGDEVIAREFRDICRILSNKAGRLLDVIDILDIVNMLGVIQTGRRGAEICLYPYGGPGWNRFAKAKKDYYADPSLHHRSSSNNSLLFHEKPSRKVLSDVFDAIIDGGGSEPGFINAAHIKERAPYADGVNPCCVTGDTPILTDRGYVPIRETVGKRVRVWNGTSFADVVPFSAGVHRVMRLFFSNGFFIDCTANHKFVVRRPDGSDELVEAERIPFEARISLLPLPVVEAGRSVEPFEGDPYTAGRSAVEDRVRFGKLPPVDHDLAVRSAWTAGFLSSYGAGFAGDWYRIEVGRIDDTFLSSLRLLFATLGCHVFVPDMHKEVRTVHVHRTAFAGLVDLCRPYHLPADVTKEASGASGPDAPSDTVRLVYKEFLPGRQEVFCFTEPSTGLGTFGAMVTGQSEILLPDKGVCNLCEIDLSAFDDFEDLLEATWLIARANYRQTLVDFRDGILQSAWHENNEFLRLCGVSLTGIALRPDIGSHELRMIRNAALAGAYSMARELDLHVSKCVTTVKPSGTLSKVMDTTPGIHLPLSRYVFYNVAFSKHDPLVPVLRKAGYRIVEHPERVDLVLVAFPVSYDNVSCEYVDKSGVFAEPAVVQLDRYRKFMRNYVDHNVSITVYYTKSEVKDIVNWLDRNWDDYVGVSFLLRPDYGDTRTVGYQYLPQQPVDKATWDAYAASLKDIRDEELLRCMGEGADVPDVEECEGGVCPVR